MDRYDKLGIVLRIVIAIMPFIINGCPFRDYEQSLLSNKNQIQISSVELLSSSQSFSFWSFCIPSWDVSVYPEVEEQLVSDNRNQQLLFIMKSENDQSVIMFMYVDFVQGLENGVFHSIHINTEQQDNIYNYDFDQRNYEGTWILSMITIEQQQIKFQSSESVNYYNLQERIKNENKVTLIIGGTGIVINKYSLGIFRGRLSKLIQQNIEPNIYFEWIYKNCRVPKLIDEEQIVILIEDVFTFDGNTQLIKEIDQIGNRFDFSGWVKYDFQEASYTTTYLLLRLTIFQNYGDELRLGDELVKITVDLDLQNPQKCGYDVISHMYSTPIFGPVNQNYQSRFKFRDDDSYYYKQLRQWHMVQFNYEQNYGAKVSFKFIASNNIINEQFSDKEALGLFTNTKYYAIIGSDRTILKRLRGQLANVKFRYNYLTNNAELMSRCHYTCNTCDGPLSTNCLECYKQQYRILSEDLKTCSCSFGYIEQFGECKSYFQIFSSISFLDISIYQTTYICDVGQFFLPTIQQCLSWYIFKLIKIYQQSLKKPNSYLMCRLFIISNYLVFKTRMQIRFNS
ncbi:unnamed protein product [Paramecium sonneborni]|uniref:Uncharacterized protein n=1 Tax=Paramecium sonneborni TaxID=65129 RepID=A0A8S1R1V2_9CILI|nr:unnamed protein product [Paramecium sonneborni]